jgi:hypothetical protein
MRKTASSLWTIAKGANMPTRRDLLKTTATIAGSLILSKAVFAKSGPRVDFIHTDALNSWTLGSAWRRGGSGDCLNCSADTVFTNFGLRQFGMFNRCGLVVHVCGMCRRSFRDDSIKDVRAWIMANTDAEVWPTYEMVWGKRLKLETKS